MFRVKNDNSHCNRSASPLIDLSTALGHEVNRMNSVPQCNFHRYTGANHQAAERNAE